MKELIENNYFSGINPVVIGLGVCKNNKGTLTPNNKPVFGTHVLLGYCQKEVGEMTNKQKGYTSEWKPLYELRPVEQDISDFGYKKEYIDKYRLSVTKNWRHLSIAGSMIAMWITIET